MIRKKKPEQCILCGDIQIPTEETVQYQNDFKDHRTLHPLWGHLCFNWLKEQFSIEKISKMTEPCILCGDIQIPTEKSVQYRNDFKDYRTLCPSWGHSNPTWKTQFIIEIISNMTEPYILCWVIQILIDRILHFCWDIQIPTGKKQFSIQMISKMTEPYIFCCDIQIPTEKGSLVSKWFQR